MRSKLLLLFLLIIPMTLGSLAPRPTAAANTVLWNEVDPPATSGTFVSLASGDINEDGHLDIIGGSMAGIGVVAGNGDGSWTALSPVTTTGTWYGLALGDINHDGKLDLAAAMDGLGIRVWAGDGAGGWSAMTAPIILGQFWSIALEDLNLDGNLDIVAGNGGGSGLWLWTGDGAGGWTLASSGLPGTGIYADVAVGDIEGDGVPDLVAASHGEGVRAWRQGSTWTELSTGLPDSGDYYGVSLGDLDHDGDLDIVASSDGRGVTAWTGTGGRNWTWSAAATGLPSSGQYWDIGLHDLNNDGDLDIAAASYGAGLQAWTGDGGGIWHEESTGLPHTGIYYGVTLNDFDDDGILDIAAGHNSGVQAWFDDGTPDSLGGWRQIASPTIGEVYQGLDVGDWNHDGKLDIVGANEAGGIQLWVGDGGNTWDEIADSTITDLPTSGNFFGIAFGDLDHNGLLDVVAGSGDDAGIRVWLFSDGAWIEESLGLVDSDAFFDIALGDMDNDGDLDIAAASDVKGVSVWEAVGFDSGDGRWYLASDGLPDNGNYRSVAFGDLNDDGFLDLVAGSGGRGLFVWQGDGTGTWRPRTSPTDAGTWWGVAVGDVNNDSILDLVASSDGLGVQAWAGDSAFGWTPFTSPTASGSYFRIALGDINNDGQLDVAAGKGESAGLDIWTGDGGRTWSTFNLNLPTTGDYPAVALGDLDNDGYLDLIGVAKLIGGRVNAWTAAEGAPPSGWENFTPTEWISITQTTDASIQVLDAGAGLDVSTAEYAYLGDAGIWSAWEPAICSGSDGVTTIQTIRASNINFNQDSGAWPHDLNRVKFRIRDMVGNVGYSEEYRVYIDTTPPTNPTTFTSSHPPGVWHNDPTVVVDWEGAADATSGMDSGRYSYVFNSFCDLPDTIVDTAASLATSDPLDDGVWYLSVRTRDSVGNWTSAAACDGPYLIDTGLPTNPTTFDVSHDVREWSTDNTIYVDWSGAGDAGSGVYGYSIAWLIHPSTPPAIVNTTESYTTSDELGDGDSWFFNIRTRDQAGNWISSAVSPGPFYIDTTPPTSAAVTLPTVQSLSFDVYWAGVDGDGSGIAGYTVQVRDGEAGTWVNWLEGTTDTFASYAGELGHTYYFRTQATDLAGNEEVSSEIPADGDTHTTIIVNLEITALEVTQAIQNLANDVPLIADKHTFVRLHVSSEIFEVQADAWLYGYRDGEALPGSPLSPTRGEITVKTGGGDRDNIDDAFLFALPPDWRTGEVQLSAHLDPEDVYPEDDGGANNEFEETVTFQTSGDFCAVMLPVHLHPDTYYIDDHEDEFWDFMEMAKQLLPVREGGIGVYIGETIYPNFHASGWNYGLPQDFNNLVYDIWAYDFWHTDPCSNPYHWGMVHPSHLNSGGYGYLGRNEAAGAMNANPTSPAWRYPSGGLTYVHELGHNFDRYHINCTGNEEDPVWYPYPGCQIAPDEPDGYYGFVDTIGTYAPEIIEPTEAAPLMSYGFPRWIDDWTYIAMFDYLRTFDRGLELSPTLSADWELADEYLYVGGIISPTGQTAEFMTAYRITTYDPNFVTRAQKTTSLDDEYTLELEDESGAILSTHTFIPSTLMPYSVNSLSKVFNEVLPYDNRTARIVLKVEGTELASRLVSAHAPTVTLLYPNGGETISDQLTISWMGDDLDGDALRFTIQYSPDDGSTWHPLAVDWAGTSFEVAVEDLNRLPGSDHAIIRVTASDGVNTAVDQSAATFSLTRKNPQAHIIEPLTGSLIELGSTIVFRGTALDAEDESLDENAITWTSDLSGTLGVGTELWVTNLPTGTHQITMTATDSDGDIDMDTIAIYVGIFTNKIYLPTLQR